MDIGRKKNRRRYVFWAKKERRGGMRSESLNLIETPPDEEIYGGNMTMERENET